MSANLTRANQAPALCLCCRNIMAVSLAPSPGQNNCPRCGSKVEYRIERSTQLTWAYLITSMLVFIPANILPVMTVLTFGRGHSDTIMSGVIALVQAGMLPIATLVFVASIIVPVFKLVGLTILLLAVKYRWRLDRRQATVMFRFIHFIGRWSMLDLFMISILVTLVNLGGIATIHTGAGATAFAGVVVLTMLAAEAFDPRLIWDLVEEK